MKQLFRRYRSCADALRIAVGEKLFEHVPVRFQPIGPGIGFKNLPLFIEVITRPGFDEARNGAAPALRPTLRLGEKPEELFWQLRMFVGQLSSQRQNVHDRQYSRLAKI